MNSNTIYNVSREHLGEHLTLDPSVADEVGCCEAVSYILKTAGFTMPLEGIAGVNALVAWLLANGFQEDVFPSMGGIICAHSPDSSVTTGAHAGICLKYGIGSNNSSNGIFSENYSYDSWKSYFQTQGSVTRYFSVVPTSAQTAVAG